MNKTLTNYQNSLSTTKVEQIVKLLLFNIGNLHLALSVDRVRKVLTYKPIYGIGLSAYGVAHVEDKEITILDLHKRLFRTSQEHLSGQRGYLILTKNSDDELFGIWVGEAPTLVDVSLSSIRILPESYRRSDTLEIASHVLILPQKNATLTVFLLDADRLL